MIKKLLAILPIVLVVFACNKEKDLIGVTPENPYILPTGNETYETYVREVFETTGTYVLTDYSVKEYQWNISNLHSVSLVAQKEVVNLNMMGDYLDDVFFNSYSTEFLKKYGPFKFLVADTIKALTGNRTTYSSIDYVALSHVNKDLAIMTDERKLEIKGIVQGEFWGGYLHFNERFLMPSKWYKFGEATFQMKLEDLRTQKEDEDDVNPDPRKFGFWTTINDGNNDLLPNMHQDIGQYVQYICTLSPEKLEEQTKDWPLMVKKVQFIKNHIQSTFDVDIASL